jgi:CRISPR-associated exonuclease Cas4
LFSRTYRLTGKPDYLVQQGRNIIPVEVKSARAPATAAPQPPSATRRVVLLADRGGYRHRPKYGIVKYADRMFAVDYTDALRTELLGVIAALRDDLARGAASRSHDEAARCMHCGYRHACSERLA